MIFKALSLVGGFKLNPKWASKGLIKNHGIHLSESRADKAVENDGC